MKIYVSGKIAGLTEENFRESFARGCALVISEGYTPVSPLEVLACEEESCNEAGDRLENGDYLHSWQCYLRYDLIAMLDCDAIAMLPNWNTSTGAQFELDVARRIGFQVYHISSDYKELRRV